LGFWKIGVKCGKLPLVNDINRKVFKDSHKTTPTMTLDDEVMEMHEILRTSAGDISILNDARYSDEARQKLVDDFIDRKDYSGLAQFGVLHRFNDYVIDRFVELDKVEETEYYLLNRIDDPDIIADQKERFEQAKGDGDYQRACSVALESYGVLREFLRERDSFTAKPCIIKQMIMSNMQLLDSFNLILELASKAGEKNNLVYQECLEHDMELFRKSIEHDTHINFLPNPFIMSTALNLSLFKNEKETLGEEIAKRNMYHRIKTRYDAQVKIELQKAEEEGNTYALFIKAIYIGTMNSTLTDCSLVGILRSDNKPTNISDEIFLGNYVQSRYIHEDEDDSRPLKSVDKLITELTRVFDNPDKDSAKMAKVVVFEKAKDLDEIVECSLYESEDLFVRKLGKGATGETYEVQSTAFGRPMAVKIVNDDCHSVFEAKILSSLSHQNIVRIYAASHDAVEKMEHLFHRVKVKSIMMELVDGDCLGDLISQNPQGLNLESATDYSLQLMKGIHYLREKNVFHRDLHPYNIKVNSDNILKIIDFGIAVRDLGSAPKDNRRYGGKNDIFSWGLITYNMFTGNHLILTQTSDTGETTFADAISEIKSEMLETDGRLKEKYHDKIYNDDRIPKPMQDNITLALESNNQRDHITLLERLETNKSLQTKYERHKTEIEKHLGHPVTFEEYANLSKMFKSHD